MMACDRLGEKLAQAPVFFKVWEEKLPHREGGDAAAVGATRSRDAGRTASDEVPGVC